MQKFQSTAEKTTDDYYFCCTLYRQSTAWEAGQPDSPNKPCAATAVFGEHTWDTKIVAVTSRIGSKQTDTSLGTLPYTMCASATEES